MTVFPDDGSEDGSEDDSGVVFKERSENLFKLPVVVGGVGGGDGGLNIESGGGGGAVWIRGVDVSASGTYTCEALSDFPTFVRHTLSKTLTVIGSTLSAVSLFYLLLTALLIIY
ncbi:hypothetical protein Pmani_036654 [Petrolisthes manimaculis]|uniref:Uncharacterized protein n=1 Tax=Petrolisthes manimaculis TaxID=1843537 RepID=A0AAE1NJP2_9EUCA|nr:hypothetical protein Pmani_036654 [Petrolisthes manimaculis]